ncbi:site-specific integrase [Pseudoduganella sp. RAF53_2]|uniref:site-specific integrase n=1 Tax=unclassified Pseudoduganella TaxID=2637179 RepID=UPI003F961DF2
MIPHSVAHRPTLVSSSLQARTRSGIVFDPFADTWRFRDEVKNVSMRFDTLLISVELRTHVKRVFAWYLQNVASATAETYLAHFRHFVKALADLGRAPADHISVEALLTYRSSLSRNDMWHLGSVAVILRKWHSLDIPGIAEGVIDFLAELRIPGNAKGVAVLTRNPYSGPLNDLEYETLLARLHSNYSMSLISLGDYVLVLLVVALGQRPSQYASLKVMDLVESEAKAGKMIFTLNVPRSKQRGQLHRDQFKVRVLNEELGALLAKHAAQVRQQFSNLLVSPDEAPLFPSQMFGDQPKGFEYHLTSEAFTRRLKSAVNTLAIISTRTESEMNITTYRLRRTVGTRAAIEGLKAYVIAEMLDHSDTKNVSAYVQADPTMVERIDRALAFQLAPLAQAFAGVLRRREEPLPEDSHLPEIWSPQFSQQGEGIGKCGELGFCKAFAPIACYTCKSFRPWIDGPHDAILDYLLSERERLVSSADLRIASICDRTILAVSEVIQKCRSQREIG